jgi:hypothetical protein
VCVCVCVCVCQYGQDVLPSVPVRRCVRVCLDLNNVRRGKVKWKKRGKLESKVPKPLSHATLLAQLQHLIETGLGNQRTPRN